MSEPLYYFAYGSNMWTPRLRERVSSARPIGRARLDRHRMSYTKKSLDGSGKATIDATPSDEGVVHGVVFALDPGQMEDLRAAEEAYRPEIVQVALDAGSRLTAWTFYGDRIDPNAKPYRWYVDLVLAGAREHGLPERFVREVLQTTAIPDPDPDRALRHRRLLQ